MTTEPTPLDALMARRAAQEREQQKDERRFARDLFAGPGDPAEQEAPEPDATRGNYVPREGTNTNPPRDTTRDFARQLFGLDPY